MNVTKEWVGGNTDKYFVSNVLYILGTDRNSIVLILFSFSPAQIRNKSSRQTLSTCKNGESEW